MCTYMFRIISVRGGGGGDHATILISSLFIEVAVPSQECYRMCIYVGSQCHGLGKAQKCS